MHRKRFQKSESFLNTFNVQLQETHPLLISRFDERCALAQLVYTRDLAKCAGMDVVGPEEWKTEYLKIVLESKKSFPATFRDVLEDDSYFELPLPQHAFA